MSAVAFRLWRGAAMLGLWLASMPAVAATEPGSDARLALLSQMQAPVETVVDRFLRYVRIDTQSQEDSPTVPSTSKQLALANLLARELKSFDAVDVRVSEFGIVYARVPGNLPDNTAVPVLGFIAHMDTSPEMSGANVQPIVHTNYRGGDIVLPKDTSQVITVEENPVLKEMIGDDIITADGTTLLGSDDKAGCAAIMTLLDVLRRNPEIRHGALAIAFTPDEEIGTGIDKFDVAAFGAKYAYTVDGGGLGEIGDETWSARRATIKFQGKNTHPGTAKDVMKNAVYAAADFIRRFPEDMRPETTEKRTGFLHPYAGSLGVDESSLKVLLRDFEVAGLDAKEQILRRMAEETQKEFPDVKVEVEVKQDYGNMKEVLQRHPIVIENAVEAARRAGLQPNMKSIRGGTDGAALSFAGLPCPNLFTGGRNFHGKLEFNSRRGLEKTTETLVHLVQIFADAQR